MQQSDDYNLDDQHQHGSTTLSSVTNILVDIPLDSHKGSQSAIMHGLREISVRALYNEPEAIQHAEIDKQMEELQIDFEPTMEEPFDFQFYNDDFEPMIDWFHAAKNLRSSTT